MSYTRVAIALHWLIAAAIAVNIGLGWWMGDAIDNPATRDSAVSAFQWHKSIGLTVLLLSLLRLIWRFLNPAPPLPASMPIGERRIAALTHGVFYALMVGIPLSGWLYVSTQWRGDAPLTIPTLWFELFEVPHLFALNEASHSLRQSLAGLSLETHEILVWAMLLLLLLHIGAALRHQFFLHDGLLARMLPLRTKSAEPIANTQHPATRRHWLAAALTLFIAIAFVVVGTQSTGPTRQQAEPAMEAALNEWLGREAQQPALDHWQITTDNSSIRFSGAHVGRPFSGKFGQWLATIQFNPAAPGQSQIAAVIKTGSATDGVPMHDRTLPEQEWFDAANHPFAKFRITQVTQSAPGQYALSGQLHIKNHSVALNGLTLHIKDKNLRIQGDLNLDRADVDMGMESDPAGDYVTRTIGIHIDISATLAP